MLILHLLTARSGVGKIWNQRLSDVDEDTSYVEPDPTPSEHRKDQIPEMVRKTRRKATTAWRSGGAGA